MADEPESSSAIQPGTATTMLLRQWREHREREETGLTLLDAGCGVGFDAAMLVAKEPEITAALGIDISEWHVQRARARFPRLAFERLDFNEVGTRYPREFRLVLARDSIYHATDRAGALRALRQSLQSGGYLLVTDWVQTRPACPTQIRRLASTVWLTSLHASTTYKVHLDDAGFECCWYQFETEAMHAYFRAAERRVRLEQARLPEPAMRGYYDRIRTVFSTLTEMSDPTDGIIGWVFLVAKAI